MKINEQWIIHSFILKRSLTLEITACFIFSGGSNGNYPLHVTGLGFMWNMYFRNIAIVFLLYFL